jgi:hypothetical protein
MANAMTVNRSRKALQLQISDAPLGRSTSVDTGHTCAHFWHPDIGSGAGAFSAAIHARHVR